MFKKILNSQFHTITSAAIVLGAASLASRFLGLIRDRILAGTFGAGDELDIYYAAFKIPDLVFYLVVLGAISAGFIPVFLGYLKKDKKQAWYLVNSLLNIMVVALLLICGLLIIFAPWLMKLVAPGFSQEKLEMTVTLSRVMFLSPVFLGLSAIFGGVLQSFRRFFVYALAPILYNLGIIFGAVFLVKYFGLLGLAFGVALGAFLHLAMQLSASKICGFKWQPVFDYRFRGVRRIVKLMLPRTLSLALNQINVLVLTVIASTLAAGSIAVYNLAQNIWAFPLGIFGISFVTASFPRLSEEAQKKDVIKFFKTFSATARQILFYTVPAAAIFIVLRAQIVRLILGTGQFDWQDTILTIDTLAFFSIGLFAEALVWLYLRGFFAWEDTKTPFILGLISTIIRIAGAWFLAHSLNLGVPGLALGYSLGTIIYLILLQLALSKKLRRESKKEKKKIAAREKKYLMAGGKIIASAFIAGLVANRILHLIEPVLKPLLAEQTALWMLVQGSIAGLGAVAVYFLFSWLFKVKELTFFMEAIGKRLPWKKVPRDIGEINGK